MDFNYRWKKVVTPSLIFLVMTTGVFTFFYNPPSPALLHKVPKSSLNRYVNLSLIVDALYFNYKEGKFTDNGMASMRSVDDAISILWIIRELYHIDTDYTLSAILPVQGPNGGIFYNLTQSDEYSFPVYYLLHVIQILKVDKAAIFNENLLSQYLASCYNITTGGFSLKPGEPSSIDANWMIIHALNILGVPSIFNPIKNMDYCKSVFDINIASRVFSCIDSTATLGGILSERYNVNNIVSVCETNFLHSPDFTDRCYGLLTLNLLGHPATNYNSPSYLTGCISSLNEELHGIKNIHKISLQLLTVALLLGDITPQGFYI